MAGSPVGFSFQPGAGDIRGGGASTPQLPPASPIQTLSLHLPQQAAQGAIASPQLLQAPGASGMGLPNMQLLQMLLRIFQPAGAQGGMSAALQPSAQPSVPQQGQFGDRASNGPQDYAPQNGGSSPWGDLAGLFGAPATPPPPPNTDPRVHPADNFTPPTPFNFTESAPPSGRQDVTPVGQPGGSGDSVSSQPRQGAQIDRPWLPNRVTPLF